MLLFSSLDLSYPTLRDELELLLVIGPGVLELLRERVLREVGGFAGGLRESRDEESARQDGRKKRMQN